MNFDYTSYISLLDRLKAKEYEFADYHNYMNYDRCVIMRHDIDTDLGKAIQMAEIEKEQNIKSTYFVLLTGNFYNPASASSQKALRSIEKAGHEIGLHFDEAAYGDITPEDCIEKILKEKNILSAIMDREITTVSMHRPSKNTLDADLKIPGMVNSYGSTFFHGFKYLSDSRRRWRENVDEIIESGRFDRLHILTHAFWYHDTEEDLRKTVSDFICTANEHRYEQMAENITDFDSIMRKEELKK